MPDVPDEFLDKWEDGSFPAHSARDWAQEEGYWNNEIREYMDEGLSLEWSLAALNQDMPGPDEWQSLAITRDDDGSWDVTIVDNEGETYRIDAAGNDDMAADNIFADLIFHIEDYDIDIERDFDYSPE